MASDPSAGPARGPPPPRVGFDILEDMNRYAGKGTGTVGTTAAATTVRRGGRSRVTSGEGGIGWIMAGPAVILLIGFLVIPFLLAFVLAFTNQRLISPNPTEFVGARNFSGLLTVRVLALQPQRDASGSVVMGEDGQPAYPALRDFTRDRSSEYYQLQEFASLTVGDTRYALLSGDAVFLKALVNTIVFALVIVPLQSMFGLLLALLINRKIRGVNVFRTIYFMPVVVSIVVVSLLWKFLYSPQGGLVNAMLGAVSFGAIQPIDWLGNPSTALFAIIVMSIWQAVGFHMVIWLAGLQTIPSHLYEAASIDGAGRWESFKNVTWPGLRNTAVFILITITIAAFGLFAQIDVMTRGGPLDSTQTVIYQAVQHGFEQQDIAYGSAISVVFFVMVLAIALIQRRLTRDA